MKCKKTLAETMTHLLDNNSRPSQGASHTRKRLGAFRRHPDSFTMRFVPLKPHTRLDLLRGGVKKGVERLQSVL